MKKKVFALFACLIFTLTLAAGCGNKDTAETPDTSAPAEQPDALAPMTDAEIRQMFMEAMDIYTDINLANFDTDPDCSMVKEDLIYYKIIDERFESSDDFLRYLNLYFTEDMIQAEMMNDMLFTEGKDGSLYVLAAGRGMDIFYAGYSVGEPVVSEEKIAFDVTAYYTMDEPYDGEIFTEAPAEPVNFETETYHFILIPEGTDWKFDGFHLFY